MGSGEGGGEGRKRRGFSLLAVHFTLTPFPPEMPGT